MTASIPEDCDLLLMYAPASDLSEDEVQMLTDYLGSGGKLMILLGDTSSADLPNLEGILNTIRYSGGRRIYCRSGKMLSE